ncbi:MAG: ABC transporter ATP-binding protein [Anaerovoracaceae bacterium]
MEILRAENITKVYGTGPSQVNALRGINLSIKKGEFVAIMGPSGSGKSTLLHILGGVDRPDRGKIFIDGEDISQKTDEELAIFRRRQIGLVYQFYNLIPVLNVKENLTLPVALDGRKINSQRVDELLDILNLTERRDFFPEQLSGGQQQRVAIGRALINGPALVLADEPTGNLDSNNSQDVLELFKLSNKKYKQTIIVITHNEEIALQADRIITIDDGRIMGDQETR